MAIGNPHPQSDRKRRSNMMLGFVLAGFVAVVFAVTVAKMMRGENMEAFDHVARPQLEIAQ
ncbi:MAG: cytochrome C oxidase assembly protein [Pseudomonadota bacterium]